jgi:CRISPR-associated protein Csb1
MRLMEAYRDGKIKFPPLQVDLSKHPDIGTITALELPHRIADATLRESLIDYVKFRDSYVGKELTAFALRNATGVFQYCPTALIFGFWDSAISEGGSGNKVQRSISSEINAFNAEKGVRTASRLDPLFKTQSNPTIYQKVGGGWTANPEEAEKDDKSKKPKIYKKLSEMNIGNI